MPDTQASPIRARELRTFDLDRQMCRVRFSPCGQYLAAGGYDATVRRMRVTPGGLETMPHLAGHHGWVQALAFHPDRRRLFTADSWGAMRCWNYADGVAMPAPVRVFENAHDGWIQDLAISADGQTLASCGSDRKVRLWSVETGQKLHEIATHEHEVLSVAFHPDGRHIVSGDLFGNTIQHEVSSGRRTRSLDCRVLYKLSRLQDVGGVRRLEFDASGRTLACAGTRPSGGGNVQGTPTILLFDWASGRLQHTLYVGGNGDGYVYDVVFHPDGFVMAVTSGNPGTGKFFFFRPGDEQPFFNWTRMSNCHALAVHPDFRRAIVAATNRGSNGNGRTLRDGEYNGNTSPLHLWELASS